MTLKDHLDNASKAVEALHNALTEAERDIKQLPNKLEAANKHHTQSVKALTDRYDAMKAEFEKNAADTKAALAAAERHLATSLKAKTESERILKTLRDKEKDMSDKELLLDQKSHSVDAKEALLDSHLAKIKNLQASL